ncbi:uncharacterized protein EAE97_007690 [Botrytis byssoidea]|uniref:Uncharacterized protein n=1 Tax=Botrytis byssoidea TaxID=139641 RepID=A0A9P5M2V8_9HELO|nr:uncharacterized protein EAE97_007690 [Botrytis byssoidea]KAF7937894.1 hypothetical protein EAE97_007690 [Botrytis byssoidea]
MSPFKASDVERDSRPTLARCLRDGGTKNSRRGWLAPSRVHSRKGTAICGTYIQAATIVGANAWIVHTDTGIFGDAFNAWRPERWIDCTEE